MKNIFINITEFLSITIPTFFVGLSDVFQGWLEKPDLFENFLGTTIGAIIYYGFRAYNKNKNADKCAICPNNINNQKF